MARVIIPKVMQSAVGGKQEIECEASSIARLIEQLDLQYPKLAPYLYTQDGAPSNFVRYFVNGVEAKPSDQSNISADDKVSIVTAIAGG